MKLQTPPPPAIVASLRQTGADVDRIQISIQTDINLIGEYDPQWVIGTQSGVWVVDAAKPEEIVTSVQYGEVLEFRTQAVVGSGILQAKVGEQWLDLARYSNRLKYSFSRVSKRLDQLRLKEPFKIEVEDEQDPRRCRTCGLMLEFSGEACPRCINRGAAVRRVFQLMRPYWGGAAIMMVLLLTGIAITMIGPQLTRYLVNHVLDVKEGSEQPFKFLNFYTPRERLLMVVAGLALTQICSAIVNILNGRLASRVATSITFDMRGRLISHLEQLSLSYYDKHSTGSLVVRVSSDTEAVQGFMSQLTSGFLMQILMVTISAFFMFTISAHLAVWALLLTPVVVMMTIIYYRVVYPRYERFWDRQSKQAGMINGLLTGIRVVKAFNQEDREFQRFQKSSSTLREARRSVDTSSATYYPIFSLIFTAGGWMVWYIGGKRVLTGDDLQLGDLMAFFGYLGLFYAPLQSLTQLTTWLTQFSTQMQRIFEVLDTPIAVSEASKPIPLPVMRGDIEFQNVVFGYSRQTPVLKNVSFKIDEGQMIGVVGRSGSGKTTIINLISRFYDVDEGRILIDGHNIREIGRDDLRRQIGVVLQEPFLFRGTLWQNLTYGRTDATVEAGIAASRAGNSHDFIMRQLHGYDTWVGERGAGLSGGERQRLSIARALLCEPRILILDEATSSVDSESELAIQSALSELVKGRTSIIIAHRLSTLRNCDRIMVIEEGKLVEQGTHPELMRLDGKYAKLVKIQTSVTKSDSIDTIVAHDEAQKKAAGAVVASAAEEPAELVMDKETKLTPISGHRPRWLRPRFARIHMGNRRALHVTVQNERIYAGVFALRCMPVRYPNQYLSLRWFNAENREQEIGLIRDLSEWPADTQKLINESLVRRYFVHTILRINTIERLQNYLNFKVETDLGPMEFFMRWSYDTAHDYSDRGKVLLDVEENRYVVPDVALLPHADRKLFERWIYW